MMTIIKTFEELKQLQTKEKFYLIQDGNLKQFNFLGTNPMHEDIVVAINNSALMEAVCFSKGSFPTIGSPKANTMVFIKGEYDPAFIGETMLDQLDFAKNEVTQVYITGR